MKTKPINIHSFRKDITRALALVIKASPRTTAITFVIIFFQALLPVVTLYFTKTLLELITQQAHGGFNKIILIVIGFSLVQLASALINQWSTYISTLQQQRITDYVSTIVLDKAISVDYEYYENPAYHDTLHLAQQQTLSRITQLLSNLNGLIMNFLSLFFLAGLFVTLQWFYAVLFIGLSLPMAGIKWYYSYKLFQLEKEFAPFEREANYLQHTLTGINYAKEVRVFGYGLTFIKKFRKLKLFVFKGRRKLNARLNMYSLLAELIEILVMAVVFTMLAKNAFEKTITAGVFVIYLQGFQRIQGAAKSFLQSIVQLFQQRLFLRDMFSFLDIPTHSNTSKNYPFPTVTTGLSINNVSFTYPGTTNKVLDNINMQCKPGSIIAIVGENGSGKSTLVKLLAQLYHTQQGSIKINDTNISDIAQENFRSNSIFLFQDFEKYFFTVNENIALGEDEEQLQESKIKAAASKTGADSYITKLADGYKTRLGRSFAKGEQLSGGQWQKLALARVFYKNTKIVVLDEPTSSIDAMAEYELFLQLKEFAKDKIVVLISHKLYNMKIADTIYVMQNGLIEEQGSFNELINKNGLFCRMYEKQKLD